MKLAAAAAIALAGCYHPAADVACATTCPCPSGLECGPDNLCRKPGTPACTSVIPELDATSSDGDTDAPADSFTRPRDGACYGNLLGVRICTATTAPRTFPSDLAAINTGTDCDDIIAQSGGQGPELCVIAGTTITFTDGIRVTGPRALVLFSSGSINVALAGAILADSNAASIGPAADDASCSSSIDGTDQVGATMDGGGGGAGGSYGALGGAGGGGLKSNGAGARPEGVPSFVHGGCRGGHGGAALSNAGSGGFGGHGGGAIYLLAAGPINVDGFIDASGEGGGPASAAAGGGGGGAGGLIVLDAPTINLAGLLLASGGGGGGGSDPTIFGTAPSAGDNPSTTNAAQGGSNTGNAGSGGNGSSRNTPTGQVGSFGGASSGFAAGGGGGGGGAGYIFAFPAGQVFADTNIAPIPK